MAGFNPLRVLTALEKLGDLSKIANALEKLGDVAKIGKVLDKMADVAKVSKVLGKLGDSAKIASILDKMTDVTRLAKVLDKLGDSAKIASVVEKMADAPKVAKILDAIGDSTKIASIVENMSDVAKVAGIMDKIGDAGRVASIMDKITDVGRVANIMDKITDVGRVANILDKMDDPVRAAKILDKFEDTVKAQKALKLTQSAEKIQEAVAKAPRMFSRKWWGTAATRGQQLKFAVGTAAVIHVPSLAAYGFLVLNDASGGKQIDWLKEKLLDSAESTYNGLKGLDVNVKLKDVEEHVINPAKKLYDILNVTPVKSLALNEAVTDAALDPNHTDKDLKNAAVAVAGVTGGPEMLAKFMLKKQFLTRVEPELLKPERNKILVQGMLRDMAKTANSGFKLKDTHGLVVGEDDVLDAIATNKQIIEHLTADMREGLLQIDRDRFKPLFDAVPPRSDLAAATRKYEERMTRGFKQGLAITGVDLDDMKKLVDRLPKENVADLEGASLTDAFNLAADNSEKLGIGGFGWGVLKVAGFVGGLVGSFFPAAKPTIQKFAMKITGVQEKFDDFSEKFEKSSRMVSDFGDGFSMGDKKPKVDADLKLQPA